MKFKKFDKICVLILAIILILQGLILIFNVNYPLLFISFGIGDLLSILFWIILAFSIGTVIGIKYLE